MYRIIGADGREYGPISADQLRQWIVENRANAATHVLPEGGTEWKPLGSLPEFSLLFAGTAARPAHFAGSLNVPAQKTNAFAATGLILAIASFLCCCTYGFPLNLLALVFSIIGLSQIKNNPTLYTGSGLAIAGLVLSILNIFMYLAMLVLGLSANNADEIHRHIQRL